MDTPIEPTHLTCWRGGDLEIDFERHLLIRQGSVQQISELQWHALVTLFQRRSAPTATVTKGDLRSVLRCDTDESLRHHIGKLRRALGDDSYLKAEYGEGYRLLLPVTAASATAPRRAEEPIRIEPRLILHYYDTAAADLSPLENHGELHGEVRSARSGRLPIFEFDGFSHIVVPDSPSLRLQMFTLCCWIKLESSGLPQTILQKGTAYWLSIDCTAHVVAGFRHTNAVRCEVRSARPLHPGEWTFIAATYRPALLRLYVDDGTPPSEEFTGFGNHPPLTVDDSPLVIGSGKAGIAAECLTGALADVRIYDRAIHPSEIIPYCAAVHLGGTLGGRNATTPGSSGIDSSR